VTHGSLYRSIWTAKVNIDNVWGIYDTGIHLYCDSGSL